MKLLRLVGLATVVMGLALASQASAATITYTGNSTHTYGVYGPYTLKIDNGPKVDATCITAPLQVNPPTTWGATVYSGLDAPSSVTYTKADGTLVGGTKDSWTVNLGKENLQKAWALNQLFYTHSGADIQAIHYAIMSVFGYSGYTDYKGYLNNLGPLPDANSFHVLVGQKLTMQPQGEYGPQVFITKTPEPCSLALLGLGMAAAGIRRRRRKA